MTMTPKYQVAHAWRTQIRRLDRQLTRYGCIGHTGMVRDMVMNAPQLDEVTLALGQMLIDPLEKEVKIEEGIEDFSMWAYRLIQMVVVAMSNPGMITDIDEFWKNTDYGRSDPAA